MANYPNSSPTVLDPASEANPPVETSTEAIAPAQTGLVSVEQQANRVMDDLFGDVERSLQDGSTLPQTWVEQEETSPASSLEHLDLSQPGSLMARQASVKAEEKPETNASALALPDQDDDLKALATPLKTPEPAASNKAFDRLLLAIAALALVGTGAVWFALQTRLQQANTAVATAPAVTTPTVSQADRDFLNYVERSLGVIDRKVEIRRQTEAIATNPPTQIPPVAVAGNPGAGNTVLERIYVPVYQPPQSFNVPTVTVPTVPQQPVVGQVPGTAPLRTVVPPVAIAPAPAPNIAPAPTTTLIGVLELGNRSAALFEFNGTTRRIQIGEPIGSSGWTLVSVRNQEAIIRRNGEVRSINVGQRF